MVDDTTDELDPTVTEAECPRCHGSGKVLFVDPDSIVLPGSGRKRAPGPLGCRCDACKAGHTAYYKARGYA